VQVALGVDLTMERCELVGTRTYGIMVQDEDTTATITDTLIEDHGVDDLYTVGGAICVLDGASATITGCDIQGSTTSGINVANEGRATITDTRISGVHPDDRALYGNALAVSLGAQVTASGLTLQDNHGVGILVGRDGSVLEIVDSVVQGTQRTEYYTMAIGAVAQVGGTLDATRLELLDNEGPGLHAAFAPTVARCTDCLLSGNEFAGSSTVGGASLTLEDTTITGSAPSSNVGGGVGLYADPWGWDPPQVHVTGATISDNPIAGVYLTAGGAYHIADSEILGGEGETRGSLVRCGDAVFASDGITAWDGVEGLELTGNTLREGRGAGLFLDNASALATGNSFEALDLDLVVQGEGCDVPPQGLDTSTLASVELCPTWDYSTCGDHFELMLELSDPEALMVPPPTPTTPNGP
jgi:hypothetical protein